MWRSSRRSLAVLVCVLAASVLVVGCGGSSKKSSSTTTSSTAATTSSATTSSGQTSTTPTSSATAGATWSVPNADLYNSRAVSSPINASNVSKLKVAWTVPLTEGGSQGDYANTPVFGPNGMIYFQDLAETVFAVKASTGKVAWRHPFLAKGQSPPVGPNGVTLSDGVVYGTGETYAFALSAATGEVLWNFHTTKSGGTNIPTFFGNAGTGGAWNTPAVGPDGNVFYGLGNPYQTYAEAVNHPRRLLYNDSTVSLNGKSGHLNWYYQANPDDFHDWDMQISPIYVPSGVGGQPTILDGSKDGRVYAFNASTGKLDWQTPVGKHNGHDNDDKLAFEHKLKAFKFPVKSYPSLQAGVETNMAVSNGVVYAPIVDLYSIYKNSGKSYPVSQSALAGTGDVAALSVKTGKVLWDHKLRYSPYGDIAVTNNLAFTTTYSGQLIAFNTSTGAIVWQKQMSAGSNASVAIEGNMLVTAAGLPLGKGQKPEIVAYQLPSATAGGSTGTTTAATPSTTTSASTSTSSTSSAATAGVSLKAGMSVFSTTCASCHTLAAAGSTGTVGPNLDQLKPSDALVVKQVTNGGGGMPAFGSSLSKAQIQSVALFVSSVAGKPVKGKVKKAAGGGP
jgi:outer membrane protein assembly factor BamB